MEGRADDYQALIVPREPEAVQTAALRALAAARGPAVGRFVLSVWPTLTPGARTAAVDLLLADPARHLATDLRSARLDRDLATLQRGTDTRP